MRLRLTSNLRQLILILLAAITLSGGIITHAGSEPCDGLNDLILAECEAVLFSYLPPVDSDDATRDSRWTWNHTSTVNAYANQEFTTYDIPGMSVVVAHRGEIVYARGFGYADVASKRLATPDTIFRLASVSKAVAGIMALDMEENELIDLTRTTRFYVPSAPAHHTHLVWQTISLRSGIGHYAEHGQPAASAQYNTALSAYGFFWNDPLVGTPGSTYHYTTHAYTALGAAMEGATGTPIDQLITERVSVAYDLPTLLPENRSVANTSRSQLYVRSGGANVLATPDNISWKRLGGGLESSALDLTHLVMQVLDGDILSPTSIQKLWTPADGLGDYGYGWSTGVRRCAAVSAKSGAQLGALSYIYVIPQTETVITVLTNRQTGGHGPGRLAIAIADLILDDECSPAEETETIELLADNGFEGGNLAWQVKNSTGDKFICNKLDRPGKPDKVFSHMGSCAFRFKGNAAENSKLQQNVDLTGLVFNPDQTLSFSAFVDGRGAVNGKFKIRVKYGDGTPTGKLNVNMTATNGYQPATGDSLSITSANVAGIKLVINHRSTSGKTFVDDVSLILTTPVLPVPDTLLPLPSAPIE